MVCQYERLKGPQNQKKRDECRRGTSVRENKNRRKEGEKKDAVLPRWKGEGMEKEKRRDVGDDDLKGQGARGIQTEDTS
ncbi:uncharacterized protein SPSK_03712 [Sporothrix schenckii 1099-18]|uniref:Uncharacterized protein n=1 Tax=Sporothrix schenckii 1099-18 TaxID=1397361 RepID=A0A0F2LYN9_SPOSC|nr:uncharacterized protein SPSK_03712 [Sporothrix schenckii 1099-18]KJR82578.1 hypothetical protein SPSK_03712 [Sporothrix schenckii 1099-18]